MQSRPSPLAGSLVVIAAASLFGMLGPVSRLAYDQGIESLPFVAWRSGVGAAVLGLVVWLGALRTAAPLRPGRVDRATAFSLGIAVVAGLFLNLAIFAAFQRVTVALALLAFYTYPAMVAAVSMALGRERATTARLGALAIALVGMVLVVAGGLAGGGIVVDATGIGLALTAAACQTLFILVSRGYRTIPADRAMAVILAGTVAGCLLIATASGSLDAVGLPIEQPSILPILVVAGSLGAAVPSLLFLVGIRLVGPTGAGILMLFEPVVGVALAAVVLAESLVPLQAIGGAGVLAAALVLQRSTQHAEPSAVGAIVPEDEEEPVVAPAPGGP